MFSLCFSLSPLLPLIPVRILYDWDCGEVNVIPNELYIACMENLVPQQKPRRVNLAPALFEPSSSFLTLTTVIDCVHNYFIPVQALPSNQYTPKGERTPQKPNSKSNENTSLQHSRCIETCHEFKIAYLNQIQLIVECTLICCCSWEWDVQWPWELGKPQTGMRRETRVQYASPTAQRRCKPWRWKLLLDEKTKSVFLFCSQNAQQHHCCECGTGWRNWLRPGSLTFSDGCQFSPQCSIQLYSVTQWLLLLPLLLLLLLVVVVVTMTVTEWP